MTITIKQMPTLRLASVAHQGAYQQIGQAIDRLFGIAGPLGIPVQGVLAAFFDDPSVTPESDLRSVAGILLPDDFEWKSAFDEAGIQLTTLSGGDYATTTHKGPYAGLTATWQEFDKVAAESTGREIAPIPCFEVYVNDCSEVAPEEILTELYLPLKPLG